MEYLNSGHVAELIKELNFFDKINIKHTHEIELSIAGWFLKTQSDIRNSPKAESAEKSDNKQMDAIAMCKKAAYLISKFDYIEKGSAVHKELKRF